MCKRISPTLALACLVAFLLPSDLLAKQPAPNSATIEKASIAERTPVPIRVEASWRVRDDRSGDFARRMYRRDFQNVMPTRQGDDPVAVALDFLADEAGRLNLPMQAGQAGKAATLGLGLERVKASGSGNHVTFTQRVGDVPVWRSDVVVNMTSQNVVYSVFNESRGALAVDVTPAFDAIEARRIAVETIKPVRMMGDVKSKLYVMDVLENGTYKLVHRVTVPSQEPIGDWVVAIDARTREILRVHDQRVLDTGTGKVFNPDPITTMQDESILDNGDSNALIPDAAYDTLALTDLDPPVGGLYSLDGAWARITDHESPSHAAPQLADPNLCIYEIRSNLNFEDVNVYYHITAFQNYMQSIGVFGANQRVQELDAHGLSGADNSHYVLSTMQIAYGDGGVDDAEDADVVVHEYGHAIQHDIVPSWGGGDAGRMGEGFGDYLAWTWSMQQSTFGDDKIFNWDGHNSFWRDAWPSTRRCTTPKTTRACIRRAERSGARPRRVSGVKSAGRLPTKYCSTPTSRSAPAPRCRTSRTRPSTRMSRSTAAPTCRASSTRSTSGASSMLRASCRRSATRRSRTRKTWSARTRSMPWLPARRRSTPRASA